MSHCGATRFLSEARGSYSASTFTKSFGGSSKASRGGGKATRDTPRSLRRSGVKKGAILLMGLPSIGKGTQALKLVERFPDFAHFDTGGEIYRRINDPAFAGDPNVQEQKKIYESGILEDPQWVAKLVAERIRFYTREGKGIVFSGSPRTPYEAETIAPILFEAYGRDHVLVLVLSASEKTAAKRSRNRLVCSNRGCRYPTTKEHAGERCPQCGEKLPTAEEQKGEEWKVATLETRLKEFRERTLPALEYLLSLGIATEVIDAEKPPKEIFVDVLAAVERRLGPNPAGA